jgi:cytochrome c-type biogenesis protein CcmH
LRIVVAPELAGQVPQGAPLFVLARSDAGGPPLAAVRRSSAELPLSLTLSDDNAMIQGTSLGQVDDLVLVARVSLTGRPVQSKGDLYGQVRYDPSARGPITVTIDRVAE